MQNRKEIFKKELKNKTLKQVGKKYNLTGERVRQIVSNNPIDLQKEYKQVEINYKKVLDKIETLEQAASEIRRLSRPDRRKKVIIQKRMLVRFLRKKFKLSKLSIAKLFAMDHSSIINLLN